jgi:4-amino-4-deoxy-L-arabinose transferase-like glycosyltransferase
MKWRRSSLALLALIATHFALGLVYVWATPIFEAPDEGYHMAVIRHLTRGGGLPVQRPPERDEWEQEGSQPPLYYWLSAGLTFWMDWGDWPERFVFNPLTRIGIAATTHNVNLYRHPVMAEFPPQGTTLAVLAVRLFSLVLSCATLYLVYQLSLTLWPQRKLLALFATALVAFNPKVVFINASVNNDNLLMLLSTLTLGWVVGLVQSNARPTLLKLATIGVGLGLAALTKVSGLVLWPIVGLALMWEERKRHSAHDSLWSVFSPSLLRNGALVFGLALGVSGWWFVRNWLLYGELLGLNTMIAIAGPRAISVAEFFTQEVYGFYLSYWSVFGVFTVLPAEWVHWVFHALTAAAVIGGVWLISRNRGRLSVEAWLLMVFCGLTFVGVLRWTMQTPASQGRLMFGAIAPLSIGMAAGLSALLPQRGQRIPIAALIAVLVGLTAIIPPVFIAPRYRPPQPIAESALPAEMQPARAHIDNGIELLGYVVDEIPRHPGENLRVTLYWRALRPMTHDDAIALVLFGRGTENVGQLDSWPGAGTLPTSQMTVGAIYADAYEIPIADSAITPTLLRLRVSMWRTRPTDRLPIRIPDGTTTDTVALTVGRLLPTQSQVHTPSVADGSTFEYGLTLLGADVPDGKNEMLLYWQARERIPANYTLFLHVVDAQGNKVTQADGEPWQGDWPTSAWEPGQTFVDLRQLPSTSALLPGQYTFRLGWYDPATEVRLAAFKPSGERWPDDAVVLTVTFEVTSR